MEKNKKESEIRAEELKIKEDELKIKEDELKIKQDEYTRKTEIIELERLVLQQKLQENKTSKFFYGTHVTPTFSNIVFFDYKHLLFSRPIY